MEKLKICSTCKTEKALTEFRTTGSKGKIYYVNKCKKCDYILKKQNLIDLKKTDPNKYNMLLEKRKLKDQEYYKNNLEKRKAIDKEYYKNNKKKVNDRNNAYYKKNAETIKAVRKIYRQNDPEKVKAWKNSYFNSVVGKIAMNLRRRVRKEIGSGKQWLELLDCTQETLQEWFKFNFELDSEYGFTWENYGEKWSIDHVIPCSSFDLSDEEQAKKCFSWENTMPVDKIYNQSKNDKIVQSDIDKLQNRLKIFKEKFGQTL